MSEELCMSWSAIDAPIPRIGLDGEKPLHHVRRLHGRLFELESLDQIEYLQPCRANYKVATRTSASSRTADEKCKAQRGEQAAVHASEEKAEVLGIKPRSGYYIERNVWRERFLPMQAHQLARGRRPCSIQPTNMFLGYHFQNDTINARYRRRHNHFPDAGIECRMHRRLEPVALRIRQTGRQ